MNFKRFDSYWKEVSEKISWTILKEMVLHKSKCFGVTPWETITGIFDNRELIKGIPEEIRNKITTKETRKYHKIILLILVALGVFLIPLFIFQYKSSSPYPNLETPELRLQNIRMKRKLAMMEESMREKEKTLGSIENLNVKWKRKYDKSQEKNERLELALKDLKDEFDQEKKQVKTKNELKQTLLDYQGELQSLKTELKKKRNMVLEKNEKIATLTLDLSNLRNQQHKPLLDSNEDELLASKKLIQDLKVKLRTIKKSSQDKLDRAQLEIRELKENILTKPGGNKKFKGELEKLNHEVAQCISQNNHLNSRIKNLTTLLETQRRDLTQRLKEEKLKIELDEELVDRSFYHLSKKHHDLSNRYTNLIEALRPIHMAFSNLSIRFESSGFEKSVLDQDWPGIVSKSEIIAKSLEDFEDPLTKLQKILEKFSNLTDSQEISKFQ